MKKLFAVIIGAISRRIARDYATGKNGWDEAIEVRKMIEAGRRIAKD